ncbi:hypothetical protein DYH11_03280 [Candidatus Microgenomates bacterium CPR3]|nr:hypothetical protein [Candidatus Microgenomates bacterium CPR3]
MTLAESGLTATEVFFKNPCIITSTRWKFEVLLNNLSILINKHCADFTIAFSGGYMDRVLHLPISVVEEDAMIGTPDLITKKASDQVMKMWEMAIDEERHSIVPDLFLSIVENGGEFGTIATDVAAREIWLNEIGESVGSWRRVLNFHFSKPTKEMTASEMRNEIDSYCDKEYGSAGRKATRAVDATIGLTRARFSVRTSVHKQNDLYVPPTIKVFTGRETAGLTMDVHPLSDKVLRKMFFDEHVARSKEIGMSEKEAYEVFDGRAGLGRMEDLVFFCRHHNIDISLQLPEVGEVDELKAIKLIAEGGSYKLFGALLLFANTHPSPGTTNGFDITRQPKNATMLQI